MNDRRSLRRPALWLIWILTTALAAAWLGDMMLGDPDRSLFLPGETSYGHHQIELACNACHTERFTDRDDIQQACESCHLDQLKAAKDDHPKSKFTDPRNAERVAKLDARYCVTCHVEHRPDVTLPMGLTIPVDFCFNCHEGIADERPSHADMGFETCASAGCHNFHDNRALYEDFLLKHAEKPAMLKRARRSSTPNLNEIAQLGLGYPIDAYPFKALTRNDIDAPASQQISPAIDDYLASRHAAAGANCSACHGGVAERPWNDSPGHNSCVSCHTPEVESFMLGKHGMRLNVDALGVTLPPMTTDLARLEMHADAAGKSLGCSSCHAAHRYDTDHAATDACLSCHADDHSRNFLQSAHALTDPPMSCATCHMPMADRDVLDGAMSWTYANHNQSENFLPNEKMIRPVCQRCHGLEFAINALADEALVNRNFTGQPVVDVPGIRMAVQRIARIRAERAAQAAQRASNQLSDPVTPKGETP